MTPFGRLTFALFGALLFATGCGAPEPPPYRQNFDLAPPAGLDMLLSEDFEAGSASHWCPMLDSLWRIAKSEHGLAYELFRSGKHGRARSPDGMAMLREPVVTDCCVGVQVRCMQRTDGRGLGRDMCIFFGYQDPTHFYYVHFSNISNAVHNAILKVDGKDREPITKEESPPARLHTQGWYWIKVEHDANTGDIRAYIEDMKTPVMTARDETFRWGLVGLGAFGDLGYFDDLKLYGLRHQGGEQAVLP